MNPDLELDCTGLICPLPVLRARKALKGMAPGQVLRVTATDKGAPRDFDAFCEASGNRLLRREDADGVFAFVIERAPDA
ncbi:MAG TPA: sulfurtransferase TusA family protein [Azospirillaceae bacterium]|nr:sulfurtransferase TusA family protein [Azospirillaceae bacterium]